MTTEEKLQCAIEAIEACGNTGRAYLWMQKYAPESLKYGITTMQYSCTVALMDKACELIAGHRVPFDVAYRLEEIHEHGRLVAYKPIFE